MSYLELLRLAAPQAILVIAALIVLAADLVALRGLAPLTRRRVCALFGFGGCLLAGAWTVGIPASASLLQGMVVADSLIRWINTALLALTCLAILISADSEIEEHIGEYFALVLIATAGMMFLASTEDLLMVFLALELTSVCLYVLTAFNPRRSASAEAALKYFLFGGMAAAITLFGMSLLYGLTGSTSLPEIGRVLISNKSMGALGVNSGRGIVDPVLAAALVMTAAGFAFKVAAAPFHLWAPDTYQGAPTPSAALIASGSKVAGFFIFAKVLLIGAGGARGVTEFAHGMPGWVLLIVMISAASIVVGNLAALAQRSIKRLLAYSAVAHAGYMLLGVVTPGPEGMASLIYYVATYGLATVGAFGVIAVMETQGDGDALSAFAGLHRRSPFLSVCLFIYVLSLAGIPPLAGFFAKFSLFAAALRLGQGELRLLWLVILALAGSAVSLYYYLQVLKLVYVHPAPPDSKPIRVPVLSGIALALAAAAVALLGCFPEATIRSLLLAGQG